MNLLSPIRKKKVYRIVAAYVALNLAAQYFIPISALALTSGPGQEEFTSFEPATTTDMVDLYSGDFTYNIPLLAVPGPNGGYPINISYHSGVGMEQEASWVGLGWNLNVGAINRQLRGLPDDFNGDPITHTSKMRDNWTAMLDLNPRKAEEFGFPPSSSSHTFANWQLYFNSYKGFGFRGCAGYHTYGITKVGANVTFDSQNGIGIEPDLSISSHYLIQKNKLDLGLSLNSRQGIQSFSFGINLGALSANGDDYGEDNKGGLGIGGNSSLTFSTIKSVPSISVPMSNINTDFDISLVTGSPTVFGHYHAAGWSQIWTGSFSNSSVQGDGNYDVAGYGYMYDHNAIGSDYAQRDFQRDPIPYSKKVPALSPASMTYDTYSITGQGTGGMFRDYSAYIPVVGNARIDSYDENIHVNLEAGSNGTFAHVGMGAAIGSGTSSSGLWQNTENGSNDDVQFLRASTYTGELNHPTGSSDPSYEYSFPKMYGEKSGVNATDDFLSEWDGDEAIRVSLARANDASWFNQQFVAEDKFLRFNNDASSLSTSTSNNSIAQRQNRSSDIEQVTFDQASEFSYTKNIGHGVSAGAQTDVVKTMPSYAQGHHISEISVVQSDGMRYVYGLPAYNITQKDAVFSVAWPGSALNRPTVSVPQSGTNIDPSGTGTHDKFLSQTELPAYVHSWMLTEVVSPDYVDITGDGPTDDDLGYWVKFNYAKRPEPYNWRVPYADCNYSYNSMDDADDDQGSFVYGEKEMYYLQSIETKTHIAVFNTSVREDGIMAKDFINGGRATSITSDMKMCKLDSISLYTKSEYFTTGYTLRSNPIPLQVTHFVYSYDLCGDVPNNSHVGVDASGGTPGTGHPDINSKHGKLTLTKLYITYGSSTRGGLSPYVFDYDISSSTHNPDYHVEDMDRWGNYKDNHNAYASALYPYMDMPYTVQGTTAAAVDKWLLRSVTLPTGGKLNIEYESDDYQYVENKRALEMLDIVGTSEDYDPNYPSGSNDLSMSRTNTTIEKSSLESYTELNAGKYRLYFKLEQHLVSGAASQIYDNYLDNGNLDSIYFNAMVNLKGSSFPHFDRVKGYAKISLVNGDYGVIKSNYLNSYYDVGFITLIGVPKSGDNSGALINPLTRAGLEQLHYERPDIAFAPLPESNNPAQNLVNILGVVIASPAEFASMFTGYNSWAYFKGYSHEIQMNGRSVIRLADPDKKKFGGGVRVKKLTLTGAWENGSDTENFEYGQTYSYVMEDGTSSGVAYEPPTGGDEDALVNPLSYENSTFVVGSQHQFLETPLLKSYYPGASVGYRRVIVDSYAPVKAKAEDSGNDLLHTAAPTAIYEFYSPKDFPVLTDMTEMSSDPSIIRPVIIPGVFSSFKKRIARSQGYSVIINDMAGKLKSITLLPNHITSDPSFSAPDQVISKQTFIYETKNPYNPNGTNELSSKVQTMHVNSSGVPVYETAVIGESSDLFIDMNENIQKSKNVGLDANVELGPSLLALIPIFNSSKFEASQRTVVMNKAIYRTGILKEVITQDHQSIITTQNLAYDIATGEPILTKVINEFHDDIFQFSYPGHWYYDALESASQNYGVNVFSVSSPITPAANGRINLEGVLPAGKKTKDYFAVGDELIITFTGNTKGQYTVIKVGDDIPGGHTFIDCINTAGSLIATSPTITKIRVVRSGHRNMQSIAVGSLAAKAMTGFVPYEPANTAGTLKTSETSYSFSNTSVLDASAIEYSDLWRGKCFTCATEGGLIGNTFNPYHSGNKGLWRPYRSWKYNIDRSQSDNIRDDGTFSTFSEFDWITPANSLADNWVVANEITSYSPASFELENKDAIGNYSAALYEYNNSLATAVASNARYKEIASESFEDYAFYALCSFGGADHWGFTGITPLDTVNSEHHTGRLSLHVGPSDSKSISRTLVYSDCDAFYVSKRAEESEVNADASTVYTGDTCDCLGQFSPIPGKQYVISAWVKQDGPVNGVTTYAAPELVVTTKDHTPTTLSTATFTASGNIIEGWQRVYGTFTVPSGTDVIKVDLVNSDASLNVFFDDIRIQPFDSNMMTYVYDPYTMRLSAQLDANNYATFYYYDSEGRLSVMKQETEKGIKTIKEGRTSTIQQ